MFDYFKLNMCLDRLKSSNIDKRVKALSKLESIDLPEAEAVLQLAEELESMIPYSPHYSVSHKVAEFLPEVMALAKQGRNFRVVKTTGERHVPAGWVYPGPDHDEMPPGYSMDFSNPTWSDRDLEQYGEANKKWVGERTFTIDDIMIVEVAD